MKNRYITYIDPQPTDRTLLLLFEPDSYIKSLIKDVKDVYINKLVLKSMPYTEHSATYISTIIRKAVEDNKRLRTLDCLKVLKALIKQTDSQNLPIQLLDNSFYLFQEFHNHPNIEMGWAVTVFLKDKILTDDQIEWLINNSDKSLHALNRLLKYPEHNESISDWAKGAYLSSKFKNRKSELLSRVIESKVPGYIKDNDEVILWAIYYSPIKFNKESLLREYLNGNNVSAVLNIAIRLDYIELVKEILQQPYDGLKT